MAALAPARASLSAKAAQVAKPAASVQLSQVAQAAHPQARPAEAAHVYDGIRDVADKDPDADGTPAVAADAARFRPSGLSRAAGLVLVPAAAAVPHVASIAAGARHILSPDTPFGAALSSFGYGAANLFSFVFPLPQLYRTFVNGHAHNFPLWRAGLGFAGTLSLGLINAAVLHKELWGSLHTFIALGMIAPFVIGRVLERRGGGTGEYLAPQSLAKASYVKRLAHRVRHDGALKRTALVALPLVAASFALYFAAAAIVPGALSAVLSAKAVSDLLLWLQVAKAALFIGVFAPDVGALLKGKQPHGFTFGFNLVYFMSVMAFTIWGGEAAWASPAGPIRDQYVVLALRNLVEAAASFLSLAAIWRARRAAKK